MSSCTRQAVPGLREAKLTMLADILIALLITAVAVVLGVIVHPVLFFLVVLAIVWLFARRGTRRRASL